MTGDTSAGGTRNMATRPPRPVPILPRSGLYLEPFGCGDEARFARAFAAAWREIPLGPRRAMLRHWRTECGARRMAGMPWIGGPGGRPYPHVPRVQLLHGWDLPSTGVVLTAPDPDRRQDFGASFGSGYLLRFWAPAVDRMPEGVLGYLVAHELAHVYQDAAHRACRRRLGVDHRPDWMGPTDEENEADADLLAHCWGFADDEYGTILDEWSADAGYTRRIVFATAADYLAHIAAHGTRHAAPTA